LSILNNGALTVILFRMNEAPSENHFVVFRGILIEYRKKKFMDEQLKKSTLEALCRQTEDVESTISGYGLKKRVVNFIHLVRAAMYPTIFYEGKFEEERREEIVESAFNAAWAELYDMAKDVLCCTCVMGTEEGASCLNVAAWLADEYMKSLPEIARILSTDITAAYDGDPAARSKEEVMLAYPAFEAISIFRLAHRMFELKVPLIPRMMTEYAHQRTGIDIHPGAKIGEYFFIDHGTGVVIGETCEIGRHVKLYQGVTLGAKSFDMDENGHPVKGGKRHPKVEDRVVIYAGATVLGGDTVIGARSIIGGSVWLTHSVPADSVIYNKIEAK